MKTIKLIAIGALVFFMNKTVQAQKIIDDFFNNLVMVDRKLYLSEEYKDKAFMFCIGIQVSNSGQVKNVVFSDKSQLFLGRLIDFPKIESKLRYEKTLFKNYRGQFLILPIFITRGDSKWMSNLDEMEQLWKGMIGDLRKTEQNPVLLLPQFMRFAGEVIIN